MPYACAIRRLLLVIAVFSVLAIVSTSAWAVDMELYTGFDNTTKAGVWSPIGVKLTNSGGRTIDGVIEVQQDTPNRSAMPVCAAKVSLPANSTKLYYVYTRRQEYGGPVKVSLMRGSRTEVSKSVSPTTVYRFDKMIVSLGDRSSRLSFLSGERVPLALNTAMARQMAQTMPSGQTDSTVQAASLSPLMLPDRPSAYQAIDVMVVPDLGPASVDPKALKAISMWVAGGGTLVVSTGPNFRDFRTEFFDELLPVRITGATSVPSLSSLLQMGKTAFPGGPVAVAASTPKPGICNRVLSEGGVPVYAERRYGAGRVVYLAFDYRSSPFRDWNGQTEFWKTLIMTSTSDLMVDENSDWWQLSSRYPGYNPGGYSGSSNNLSSVVEQNPSVRTPSFNVIALYLLAYLIFLVPLNYMYLKRKRRMELAWISTPAIVLLFTFGAYAIGYTMKGGKIEMGVATVIEGSSSCRYARTISDASLFSPSRRSYNIEISDPYAIGQTIPQERSETMPTAYVGEKTSFDNVNMAMWSSKNIESTSGVDLGGTIESKLQLAGNRMRGTITNNTRMNLRDCRIRFTGNRFEVGNLPKGRTVSIDVEGSALGQPAPRQPAGYAGEVRTRLNNLAEAAVSSSGTPVLVGFAEQDPTYALSRGQAKVTGITCCLFRLDVAMGGTSIFSPNTIAVFAQNVRNARPAGSTPPGVGRSELSVMLMPSGSFEAVFQLPAAGEIKLAELSLRHNEGWSYHGGGMPRVRYSFCDSSGRWTQTKAPSGANIPNPGKYLLPGNRVLLKVESLENSEVTTRVSIGAMGNRK